MSNSILQVRYQILDGTVSDNDFINFGDNSFRIRGFNPDDDDDPSTGILILVDDAIKLDKVAAKQIYSTSDNGRLEVTQVTWVSRIEPAPANTRIRIGTELLMQ